jgi:predicted regulator of Ras-like GTPase activity (Roadblock/LC7/MglB family)
MVLKELNTNGNFRASLFSTGTGLVLASQKSEEIDERVVAAMSSLLSDSAYKAREELSLSNLSSMKIKFEEDLIIMENIPMPQEDNQFLLAILARAPDSEEVEKYYDDLIAWAVDNAREDLRKLSSI